MSSRVGEHQKGLYKGRMVYFPSCRDTVLASQSQRTALLLLYLIMSQDLFTFTSARASIKIEDHDVIFTKVGETVVSTKYVQIFLPQNISAIEQEVDQLQNTVRRRMVQETQHGYLSRPRDDRTDFLSDGSRTGTRLYSFLSQVNFQLETIRGRCTKMRTAFQDLNPHPTKAKRFIITMIVAAIALTATAGAITAGVTWNEISKNREELATLAEATEDVAEATQRLGETPWEIAKLMEKTTHLMEKFTHTARDEEERNALTATVRALERRISTIETGFTAAMAKRLAIQVLNTFDFGKLSKDVKWKAEKLGMIPIARFGSDWTQFETTWLSSEYGFDIITHVPVMDSGAGLDLYRFANIPITIGQEDKQLHVTLHKGEAQYIASDTDRSMFKTMTLADLQQCNVLGNFYMCDTQNVVYTNKALTSQKHFTGRDQDFCLFALITYDNEMAVKYCDLSISHPRDTVVMVGPHKFASYYSEGHLGQMRCRDKPHQVQTVTFQGLQTIEIPPNCHVTTDTAKFEPSDNIYSRHEHTWQVSYKWPAANFRRLSNLTSTQWDELVQEAHAIVTHTKKAVDLDDAINRIQAVKAHLRPLGGISTPHAIGAVIGGFSITSIAVMLALALGIYNLLRQRKGLTPITLTTVAAPTNPPVIRMDDIAQSVAQSHNAYARTKTDIFS